MNTTTPKSHGLAKWQQALRWLVICGLAVWFGFLFYTGQNTKATRELSLFLFLAIWITVFEFLVGKGYLKMRSQDSWLRISGVTVFILLAAILVAAVAVSFLQ